MVFSLKVLMPVAAVLGKATDGINALATTGAYLPALELWAASTGYACRIAA